MPGGLFASLVAAALTAALSTPTAVALTGLGSKSNAAWDATTQTFAASPGLGFKDNIPVVQLMRASRFAGGSSS